MRGGNSNADRRWLMDEIRKRHPALAEAMIEDAKVTAQHRGERHRFRSRTDALLQAARLMWISDAFLAQTLYRVKARLQAAGIPVLPRLAHRLAMAIAQVSIGDPVVVHPGVYIIHGQVVIDGLVEIHPGVAIGPFVTIGLRRGDIVGPTIQRNAIIGTGAKVLGRVTIGARAQVGANSLVLEDVEPGATVLGVPARAAGTERR